MKVLKTKNSRKIRRYNFNMFKDSSMTGVSQIIQVKGCIQKSIKIILLAFSLAGFLYQTYQFLQLYWEYSTIEMEKKSDIMLLPSVTFCDTNYIRRTYLCRNAPEMCTFVTGQEKELFCRKHELFCMVKNKEDIVYAIGEIQQFTNSFFDLNFTKEGGFQVNESIASCEWIFRGNQEKRKNEITRIDCGSPKFVRHLTGGKIPLPCYTLNSYIGEENPIVKYIKQDTVLILYLKWKPEDVLKSNFNRYYTMTFHHPVEQKDPAETRNFLIRPFQHYKVNIRQETIVRLPPPYDTRCRDYEKEIMEHEGKGFFNKAECIANCQIKIQKKIYGCVFKNVVIPHEEKLCHVTPTTDFNFYQKINNCTEQCPDACRQTRYFAKHQIVDQVNQREAYARTGSSLSVFLEIHFNPSDSTITLHKPLYESVELFSYIGGYLGIWLGWCLVAVLEFIETLIILFLNLLKKKNQSRNPKVKRTKVASIE